MNTIAKSEELKGGHRSRGRQKSGHSRTPVPPPTSLRFNGWMDLSRIFADLKLVGNEEQVE